jgi:hypothetical protein
MHSVIHHFLCETTHSAIGYSWLRIFLDFLELLPSLPKRKKALVAGALGVTERTLVDYLVSLGPEFQTGARHISVDLSNRSTIESQLSGIVDVTHIFYAALYWKKNVFDEVGPNMAMLTNLVETVERTSNQFRKVVLLESAKYYGAHLGPYKTPAKEDDPPYAPEFLL